VLESEEFDLVLMDCQMPVMDGYRATAAIREREVGQSRHLPVVALTANAMEGDRGHCIDAGMDDYLAKPYSLEQLQTTLSRWLALDGGSTGQALDEESGTDIPGPRVPETVIDTKVLDQLRELDPDGDMDLVRQVIVAFMDSAEDAVAQTKAAILMNNAENLRVAAHSLKSSSANVGAQELSAIFRELEHCGREGRMADAGPLLEVMQGEYGRSRKVLQELVRET
jgi:two-component system, sensor histidine kinase and response regulator